MNNVRYMVLDALLVASTIVLKEALAFLPNIEMVTLLMMVYALTLPKKDVFLIVFVYATVESLLYGFGLYSFSYYAVWFLIVFFTLLLKKYLHHYLAVAIFSFFMGLFFDLPFSILYFLLSVSTGISYLLSGAIFSLVHALGNFIVAVLLFEPLYRLLSKIQSRIEIR